MLGFMEMDLIGHCYSVSTRILKGEYTVYGSINVFAGSLFTTAPASAVLLQDILNQYE